MLLLIDVPNLEPDVGVSKGIRGVAENAIEAVQGLLVFALLLVDDAEPEVNLVGLVEV